MPAKQGAQITHVEDDSQASEQGLQKGDVIVAANQVPIASSSDLTDVLSVYNDSYVTIELKRGNEKLERQVDPAVPLEIRTATVSENARQSYEINPMYPSSNVDGNGGFVDYGTSLEPLAIVFYVLAGLSLLSGLILGATFWPEEPGYGETLPPGAHSLSIMWIVASIVEAVLFAGIGRSLEYLATGVSYLAKIAENTRNAGE